MPAADQSEQSICVCLRRRPGESRSWLFSSQTCFLQPRRGQLTSTRPGFFRSNQLKAGAGPDLVTSIYTHYRPVFISQGSHSVNEMRDKNPGKYKPFRLRDLSATAVCLTRADPLYLGLKAKLRNREVQKYSQIQISNMLKSQKCI